MRYFPFKQFVSVVALAAGVGSVTALAETWVTATKTIKYTAGDPVARTTRFGDFGTVTTNEEMGNYAWASGISGKDLPPGQGTAKQGASIFMERCSMCHGVDGKGGKWKPGQFSPLHGVPLHGGTDVPHYRRITGENAPPPAPDQIVFPMGGTTTPWNVPWTTVIFNAVAIEMPLGNPGTLKADEVYSLVAWILFKNGFIKEDEVMNRETLIKIQLPLRNAFPASDEIYMDMKKRGCWKTFGECRDP